MVNAIGEFEDRALFWYGGMLAGAAMVLVGLLMTSWVRATGRPVPRYVGWVLVGLGVGIAVLQPLSGGALVVVVGMVALTGPRAGSREETNVRPDAAASSASAAAHHDSTTGTVTA